MVSAREAARAIMHVLQEAGVEDAGHETDLLFRHVAGKSRFLLDELNEAQWETLQGLAARRAKREPLQYILGKWPFLELELLVGPGVLAPRPETEEVCLAAAALLKGKEAPAVLDLCAGSGALALGLQSLLPGARITAVEWDEAAFAWLVRNVEECRRNHGWANTPKAVQADALTYYKGLPAESVDLVLSNPPYVAEAEYAALAPEVHAEPKRALVAPEEGLLFYRVIPAVYRDALAPGGHVVFEIGAGQGPAVAALLEKAGYVGVEIRKDMAGHDRLAFAEKPAIRLQNQTFD